MNFDARETRCQAERLDLLPKASDAAEVSEPPLGPTLDGPEGNEGHQVQESTFLSLHDDLQRRILYNNLDVVDKVSASQVCRDWRRLLITDCDPGAWGELELSINLKSMPDTLAEDSESETEETDWRVFKVGWHDCSKNRFLIRADAESAAERGAEIRSCLECLLGGRKSLQFSHIVIGKRLRFFKPEPGPGHPLLQSILALLSSASFSGRFVFDSLWLEDSDDVSKLVEMARSHPGMHFEVGTTEVRFGDDMAHWNSLQDVACAPNLSRFGLVKMAGSPGIIYGTLLAHLPSLDSLCVSGLDDSCYSDDQPSYGQFTALSGLTYLCFRAPLFPDTVPELSKLSALSGLRALKLYGTCFVTEIIRTLSNALSRLPSLTMLNVGMMEPDEDEYDEEWPDDLPALTALLTSSLTEPLSLPASVQSLALSKRIVRGDWNILFDFFRDLTQITGLSLSLDMYGEEDSGHRKTPRLVLGDFLSCMSSLSSLTLNLSFDEERDGGILRGSNHFYVEFPESFSALTALQQLTMRGHEAVPVLRGLPAHWDPDDVVIDENGLQYG